MSVRAAIVFSGRGSNMGALLRASQAQDFPVEFVTACTDNPTAGGIALAQDFGLETQVIAGSKQDMEDNLDRVLRDNRVDLVVLAGFMRLLSASFVERYYGRILNIHPSLLPQFKGLHPQQQAIDAGAEEAGCSVHIVTAEMDGGPVIGQAKVPVLPEDTAETLSERILVEEHRLYPHIVAQYAHYIAEHPPISGEGLLKVPFSSVKEECGIFACHGAQDALALTIFGLHAIQHRGQEGVGIATIDNGDIFAHRDVGLVSEIFSKQEVQKLHLPGQQMIGHLRYSTAGGKSGANLQPFVMQTRFGSLALAHNGNLTNADELRKHLMNAGQVFFTDSDSEVFMHLMTQSDAEDLEQAIIEACMQTTGAFSILILSDQGIFAARDPLGMRPLCLGKRDGQIAIASESCALEAADMKWQFDIDAGELVRISPEGEIERKYYVPKRELSAQKFCAFEYVYFMRANSAFNDRYTARVRERIGMQLHRENPQDEADYVVPVPESGIFAAIGYSQASKLPFHFAILKSPYVGRTFIEPEQELRHFGVRLKLSIDRWHVKNKRIILVDDSIVRANTLPKLVTLLRDAGAKEIHVRIASPTIEYPCFYGVDMPSRAELSAANHSVEEICKLVGADSLAFVSVEGLRRAIDASNNDHIEADEVPKYCGTCTACFTGAYPAPLCDQKMQDALAGSLAQFEVNSPGLLFAQGRGKTS